MGCVSSHEVKPQEAADVKQKTHVRNGGRKHKKKDKNVSAKDKRKSKGRHKKDKNVSNVVNQQKSRDRIRPSKSDQSVKRYPQQSQRDLAVEADIRAYDKWQLHLAENDRLSMVQHSHRELSQPFYYPPPEVRRPRTSAELQRQQAHSQQVPKTTFLEMTTSGHVSADSSRRISLLAERQQVGTTIRRESSTKSNIYELLIRKEKFK